MKLVNTNEGDRPLFVWLGTIPNSTINLYSSSANYNYERDEQLV